MKCEDFKKYMADLCDKQTDPAITEACRQHMKECAACRAYYEDFMHTVNLLTPKHAPSFGKTQPAVSISPLQTTVKPKKHPSHKWIQIAAAVAIFMAGLGTGLSNFFSTQAEAVPSIPLIFDQSIKSSRSAVSFSMSVYARTTPNENFAYINPESGFMRISLESLRQTKRHSGGWKKKEDAPSFPTTGNNTCGPQAALPYVVTRRAISQKGFLPCFVRKHSWSNKKRHYPATHKHTRK